MRWLVPRFGRLDGGPSLTARSALLADQAPESKLY